MEFSGNFLISFNSVSLSAGRGSFQKPSSSSCLISVMSKKKSEKEEKQPEDSKEIKQDKGNTATSGKEGVPSKVKPKDSQPAEESPSQTASVASPGAAAQVELPSRIAEVLSDTKNGNTVLDKLKDCEATEDLLSQAVPILSPGVSTEDETSSCGVEVLHSTEKEDSVLLQASQSAQHSSHVCSPTSVEIPFLSENASDDQSERKEEIELTETSTKQNDTDHCKASVAPALDSSSLPSTLSDIRYVPVLVREKDTGLPYSWEDVPFHAENQRGWAPEDYQEPPWSLNQADQCPKASECYRGSESSVSSSISPNGKLNVGRLVECKSSSPKNHHSSNSKHSSTNQTSSPSSLGRQGYSSRSSHKQERSTERQERSSELSYRREHSSRSSRRQENSPQREKLKSKSSCRQEESSQKQECSSRTSPVQEHSVRSTHKRKHSSRSPKRKQSSRSQKLDRWKENKLGRGGCCHCHCCCQQSCSPSREGSWQGRSPPPYLTCKIKCLHVSKEISKVYSIPYHHSSERSIGNEKKIRENKPLVAPQVSEKKKKSNIREWKKGFEVTNQKEESKLSLPS
ncbi:uncharacterized protein LOC134493210 isoform X2 [Candoia aspera]|uniref:uncharacterized protein LOC134493210 isoform X2 n=1 Tax=Candoia aspera TaxID=51853 RepID=UPI002FD86EED